MLNGIIRPVVVLINRLQPPYVVVRVANHVHVERTLLWRACSDAPWIDRIAPLEPRRSDGCRVRRRRQKEPQDHARTVDESAAQTRPH